MAESKVSELWEDDSRVFAEHLLDELGVVVNFFEEEVDYCKCYASHPVKSHYYSEAKELRRYSAYYEICAKEYLAKWDGKEPKKLITKLVRLLNASKKTHPELERCHMHFSRALGNVKSQIHKPDTNR